MDPSASGLHARLYLWLILFYPGRFRRRFGTDMAQAFTDHLNAERSRLPRGAAARVWGRTLRDLFTSVPIERWEDLMARTTAVTVVLIVLGSAVISVATRALSFSAVVISILVIGGVRWAANSATPELAKSRLLRAGAVSVAVGIAALPFLWWSGAPEVLVLLGAVMLFAARSKAPSNVASN